MAKITEMLAPGMVALMQNHDQRLGTLEGIREYLAERGNLDAIQTMTPEARAYLKTVIQSAGAWPEPNGQELPDDPAQAARDYPRDPTAGGDFIDPDDTFDADATFADEWQDNPLEWLIYNDQLCKQIREGLEISTIGALHEMMARGHYHNPEIMLLFDQLFEDTSIDPPVYNGEHASQASDLPAEKRTRGTRSVSVRLQEARDELLECCRTVFALEQRLESTKEALKAEQESRTQAVAKVLTLEEDEETGQTALFDKHDDASPPDTPAPPEPVPHPEATEGPETSTENWKEADVVKAVGLTGPQANKFAEAGVTTMGQFEDLRYGRIKGPKPGAGLRTVERIGVDMEQKLLDRANAWLAEHAPDYDPTAADPGQTPMSPTPVEAPPVDTTEGPEVIEFPVRDPAPESPPPISDDPEIEDRRPTVAKLSVDVPGFANQGEGMYAGTKHPIVDWVGDAAVVQTDSGKTTVLRVYEFEGE